MQKSKVAVLTVTVLTAAASFGSYVIKDKNSGPYDLADVNLYGGSYPTSSIEFQQAAGPFVAKSDVTLPGLFCNWGTTTIGYDTTHPGVIKLSGNLGICNGTFKLNGCIIDFQGSYGFDTGSWNEYRFRGGSMILDGCILTNMARAVLQNNGQAAASWTMRNNARIYCNGVFGLTANAVPANNIKFSMSSGAQVVAGYFQTDGGYAYNYPHHLVLTGEGTKFSCTNTTAQSKIGNGYANASVTVSDHANLDFSKGTTYIGLEANSKNNRLTVTNNATATFNALYAGCNGAGGSNTIEVLDGAVLTARTIYLNGGGASVRGNKLIVSNATVTTGSLYNLNNFGYDSTIRISGDRPQIVVTGEGNTQGNAIESCHGTTYLFDIPSGGYASGIVPIRVQGANGLYGDSSLRFRFTGIEDLQRTMTRSRISRVQIPLITVVGGISVGSAVMDDANAALPERCRLYNGSYNGNTALMLEVKSFSGTIIVIH